MHYIYNTEREGEKPCVHYACLVNVMYSVQCTSYSFHNVHNFSLRSLLICNSSRKCSARGQSLSIQVRPATHTTVLGWCDSTVYFYSTLSKWVSSLFSLTAAAAASNSPCNFSCYSSLLPNLTNSLNKTFRIIRLSLRVFGFLCVFKFSCSGGNVTSERVHVRRSPLGVQAVWGWRRSARSRQGKINEKYHHSLYTRSSQNGGLLLLLDTIAWWHSRLTFYYHIFKRDYTTSGHAQV